MWKVILESNTGYGEKKRFTKLILEKRFDNDKIKNDLLYLIFLFCSGG